MKNLDALHEDVGQYLATALWSSIDDDDRPLDRDYCIGDFHPSAVKKAEKDVKAFLRKAAKFLREEPDTHKVGHDFWLTRNHHGAGFWDGDYRNGDALTKIAHSFGEAYVEISGDGKLYLGG